MGAESASFQSWNRKACPRDSSTVLLQNWITLKTIQKFARNKHTPNPQRKTLAFLDQQMAILVLSEHCHPAELQSRRQTLSQPASQLLIKRQRIRSARCCYSNFKLTPLENEYFKKGIRHQHCPFRLPLDPLFQSKSLPRDLIWHSHLSFPPLLMVGIYLFILF